MGQLAMFFCELCNFRFSGSFLKRRDRLDSEDRRARGDDSELSALKRSFTWSRRTKPRTAVWTIHIRQAYDALALRAARTELVVTTGAEIEFLLYCISALWAATSQRLPQDEVENDTQSVGNENGHNRPQDRAHATAFGVAVDVTNEQQKTAEHDADQETQQRPRPCGGRIMLVGQGDVKYELHADEPDCCQSPCPSWNNLDFRRWTSLNFFFR